MFSFWVVVLEVFEEQVTIMETSCHPRAFPQGKTFTFTSHERFAQQYAYDSIPGYSVRYEGNRDIPSEEWLEQLGEPQIIDD